MKDNLDRVIALIEERMGNEHFSTEALSRDAAFSSIHFYRKRFNEQIEASAATTSLP